MDTLLVRQYNLIQCFSNPKATGNDLSGGGGDGAATAGWGGGGWP